jgi:hypothetical protein
MLEGDSKHAEDEVAIDSEGSAGGILTQLNRSEGCHRLARKSFHGQRGELCKGIARAKKTNSVLSVSGSWIRLNTHMHSSPNHENTTRRRGQF